MIYPRWKKVAIGDGCLKSSQSFNSYKMQSITLVRFKSPIASKESQQTMKYFLIFSIMFMAAQSKGALVFHSFLEIYAALSPDFIMVILLFFIMVILLFFIMMILLLKLDKKFDALSAEIRGTPAKDKAKEFTIAIVMERNGHNSNMVIGHGLLLLCAEQDHYAILTAAHVVNDMLAYKETWELAIETLSGGHKYYVDLDSALEIFVLPHYVRKGEHDCGVMIVKLKNRPTKDMFKELMVSQDNPFDNEYVGLSKTFRFRGEAFTCFGTWRVGLGIPSKPGCSGTPFFCPRGRMLAVLHGEWKHRGQRHTGGMGKESHSYHVYVDRVLNLDDLDFWADSYNKCFVRLEEIADKGETGTSKRLLKPPLDFYREAASDEDLSEEEAPEAAVWKFYEAAKRALPPLDFCREAASDEDLSEEEAPEAAAWKFYEAAKRALPDEFVQQQSCFTDPDFRVIEVCDALIAYNRGNSGNAPKLRERLISPGRDKYLALSIRP